MPIRLLPSLIAILAAVFVVSLVASAAWLDPGTTAPGGNVAAPINEGASNQSKTGNLNIGSGLKMWLTKLGDSFSLNNNSGNPVLVVGQDGNIGMGTDAPGAKLEVAGQIKITGGSPGLNKVLVSDAGGLADWKPMPATLPAGIAGQTLRHDGTGWISSVMLYNDGTNIGIGTVTPASKLEVAGQIKITGGSPGLNKVLVSDDTGLASWKTAAEAGFLTMSCPSHQYMTGIGSNGQPVCATIDNIYWTPNPCSDSLPPDGKRIFVSSTSYRATELTTDAVADNFCQQMANNADYTGTFKAFIYLGSRLPNQVLTPGKSFWNGGRSGPTGDNCLWAEVAINGTDFFDKTGDQYIINPIKFTEQGLANGDINVWTGFMPNGTGGYTLLTYVPQDAAWCSRIGDGLCYRVRMDSTACVSGKKYETHKYIGLNTATDINWAGIDDVYIKCAATTCSDTLGWGYSDCRNSSYPIYCVEQ
ncbi:MAG TPA: hypothetical protein P5080_05770 [Candidatus Paceibacterota bacterium]|nr:hypothetical protein [Candidatus Paceibacterota bacterium]HSA37175.1 hypothetical protein [Candidatus Paceibacterota bacterium]